MKIDSSLPQVSGLKYIADIDSIAFEWGTLNSFTDIQGYYLYRKTVEDSSYKLIATIPSRFSTHYVDSELTPNTTYLYRIASYNSKGDSSIASEPIKATTQSLAPLSFAQAIGNYPKKIKLLWSPHTDLRVNGYLIQRTTDKDFVDVTVINNRLAAEYIDIGLEDNTQYHYRIFALSGNNVKSQPSELLSAKTKPAPPIPQGVFASFDLPKQVRISWQPSMQKDVVLYRVYRSVLGGISQEQIGEVPVPETSFIDKSEIDGVRYGYYVVAVDKDGLMSNFQKDAIIGGTLPAPEAPKIQSIRFENGKVAINWVAGDERSVQYTINKQEDGFFPKKERFISIPYTYFYDSEVVLGEKYLYNVIALDKNGLESVPSQTVSITLQKD